MISVTYRANDISYIGGGLECQMNKGGQVEFIRNSCQRHAILLVGGTRRNASIDFYKTAPCLRKYDSVKRKSGSGGSRVFLNPSALH